MYYEAQLDSLSGGRHNSAINIYDLYFTKDISYRYTSQGSYNLASQRRAS
jgi:hypothetical protein